MEIIFTVALIDSQFEMRKKEYIYSLNKLIDWGYKPIITEARAIQDTFLDDYGNVFYARSNIDSLKNKGVKIKALKIKPTAMIDISDGLSSEILHLCKNSKVGCNLFEEKVPMDLQTKKMAEELNINPLVAALNGGEDYELLFTLSPEDAEKLKNDPDFTVIGLITEEAEGANLMTSGGLKIPLQAQGWNHLGE